MYRIEVDAEELAALRDVLKMFLGDLGMEISQTDEREMREDLKHRKQILRDLMERLDASVGVPAY
jgi:hypothetical protein